MGNSDLGNNDQASGGCASVRGMNRSFALAFLLTKDKALMEKLFISKQFHLSGIQLSAIL
jgi:hypothetical protein